MSGELLGALGAPATATSPGPPIYLIIEPVDMPLGIDGLSACIQTRLATSACSGGLYVFCNARKNRVKLLLWDGTGVWLAQRRLHQGSFTWPGRQQTVNGWTLERRKRQAELIRQWKPWAKSTGPKSQEGKERVARNPWRGGHRQRLRELTKMVNAEITQEQDLVLTCTA